MFTYAEECECLWNLEITELCVVDKDQKVCGLLTKQHIDECFGGRYGYSLYSKYTVGELLNSDYLEVDCRMPIEMVSRLALIRPKNRLYDAIVVSDNGTYVGIVTVKDLLEASVSIQVERAMDTNPLTHLPGNNQIERLISNNLFSKDKFSIMYLDLDNFKSYNDEFSYKIALTKKASKKHAGNYLQKTEDLIFQEKP